jgi:hypothetical protein
MLEKPTQETGIESRTVSIVYAYLWGGEKLNGALYVPDNLGALL